MTQTATIKSVVLLGGSGFVGRRVCAALSKAGGFSICVATRARQQTQALPELAGCTVKELNVFDATALHAAVAEHDAVVNLVAILHGTPAAFQRVHVELPRQLAQACRTEDVRQLVHVSALGVDPNHWAESPSHYLRSKGQGEAELRRMLHDTGVTYHVLRPSVIFGEQDKLLNVFARVQKLAPFFPLAGADTRFQPVWVGDVAQAVLHCLQAPASTPMLIEACGPDVYTLRQLVQVAGRLAGVQRPVLALPDWLARVQAALMELAPGEPVMTRDNLDSMKVANVASGQLPGLSDLGIRPSELESIATKYLQAK